MNFLCYFELVKNSLLRNGSFFHAASIGTEVYRYYFWAGLLGSKCDLSLQICKSPRWAVDYSVRTVAQFLC